MSGSTLIQPISYSIFPQSCIQRYHCAHTHTHIHTRTIVLISSDNLCRICKICLYTLNIKITKLAVQYVILTKYCKRKYIHSGLAGYILWILLLYKSYTSYYYITFILGKILPVFGPINENSSKQSQSKITCWHALKYSHSRNMHFIFSEAHYINLEPDSCVGHLRTENIKLRPSCSVRFLQKDLLRNRSWTLSQPLRCGPENWEICCI